MNVSSGTGLPGLSRTNGRSMVVVVVVTISISVYKLQIYQVAESKKSIRWRESNRIETFFGPNWNSIVSNGSGCCIDNASDIS